MAFSVPPRLERLLNFKTSLPRVGKPEAVLHCPNCNHAIKLTESLAAPLIEESRRGFQEQLAAKDAEMARRADALRQERDQLVRERDGPEDEIARRIGEERARIISQESRKARELVAAEIASKDAEAVELRNA